MAVRIEKILYTVLHEAHERQAEETMDTLGQGPEGFYKRYLDRIRTGYSPAARISPVLLKLQKQVH